MLLWAVGGTRVPGAQSAAKVHFHGDVPINTGQDRVYVLSYFYANFQRVLPPFP